MDAACAIRINIVDLYFTITRF